MAFFSGLLASPRQRRIERAGFGLYASAVKAARTPYYFTALGVPDTLDGRFDLVGLFVALLIHRLRHDQAPGPDLAQALFDAMFSDMDINLREMGVGDMSVAKRVRTMWEGFHGRASAYEPLLTADDEPALAESLRRNVWRGESGGDPHRLAHEILCQKSHLAAISLAALAQGEVTFAPLSPAPLSPAQPGPDRTQP